MLMVKLLLKINLPCILHRLYIYNNNKLLYLYRTVLKNSEFLVEEDK